MSTRNNLTNANLIQLCRTNGTVNSTNPNCPCLLSGGGPELNTDVSGLGVRISFYLQALFLALLAARSKTRDDIASALSTLVTTNIAMATTLLILGFKPNPGMSLHDAVVVIYLLSGSCTTIILSLPSYGRFIKSSWMLQALTVAQSYLIFIAILAVFATAHTFGNTPRCNPHVVGVLFYHFPALDGGRMAALVIISSIICIYTVINLIDYRCLNIDLLRKYRRREEKANKGEEGPAPAGAHTVHSGKPPDLEHNVAISAPNGQGKPRKYF